ncbi:thioredoxin family protein [Rhodobacteraceae bacterium D3-12]|nr:thioredoxin family protein [Rhodobacteraceae bacterium D3-12]
MKTVKIYGPGCKRCEATETIVRDAATKLGVDVKIEKISDAKSIAMAGVMSTPGRGGW